MNTENNIKNKLKIAFWGTGPLAESAVYAMYKNDIVPSLIITKPDSEIGRKQILTAPYIKDWAISKNIKVLQPEKLKENIELEKELSDIDICIVASYGKIIPENILNTPKYGFINVHPSDLPLLRGPSPIESQLLSGAKEIIVTIMKMDTKMDSGDIIIKNKLELNELDNNQTVERKCGELGGNIISQILTGYIEGNIKTLRQIESDATYCHFVKKEDGLISINDDINIIKNKWRAYYGWPGIYFFVKDKDDDNLRVKVTKLNLLENNLESIIENVIVEGKKEITFLELKKNYIL